MSSTAAAAAQKRALHSHLASKLTNLTIPESSSSSSFSTTGEEFDFNDVFNHPSSSSSSPRGNNLLSSSSLPSPYPLLGDPEIIHNRSHSFVGPSPRFTFSPNCKPNFDPEIDSDSAGEEIIDAKASDNQQDVNRIGPGDFEILRVVGKGAFGKVFQVRKREKDGIIGGCCNGDGIFAMKVMRKETIIKNNHVDYMKAERDILTRVVHPFIVQLRYSFQTKSKLYLILDFINGGHLFYHLYRQRFFSEDQARVYTSEIVSAVSHLHKCGIVHRDLKPENILMDSDGHVMLTDFGMAKEIDETSRSNSMCGTTEYMAPEILLSKGHDKNADWWSVGILLYEMLTGQPPYTHSNRKKLQEKIIKEKLKLPPRLTSEAHSLLKGLLQKEPSKRLGSGAGGGDDIKSHKWLKSINWKKLEAREMLPKFKPVVTGKECTNNFDKCWTTMPLDDSPADTPTAGEHFKGYSYIAPNTWLSSEGH